MITIKPGEFFAKLKGRSRSPPSVGLDEIFWSWLGSFLGIAAVAYISYQYLETTDLTMIIGSFGASAVLIYAAITSPLAQPRNLVGGHVVSAMIGVAAYQHVSNLWLASALAVSLAIAFMHATRTLHPPGGATALIAVIGSDKIHALGYTYILVPVASGAVIMLVIALMVNNLAKRRSYPEYWL
ncbi:MAG: HPP family protein [Candidatus Methanoperedens sp.]|nr:HPP family protein [Candidatus Methanoperedens sp.]MCZ7358457.1 HPP family protein [Candidatus Methanoperedens sp.]HLB70761.1 HPP family protein [Candidatus Methanoperedens sp.]